MSRLALTISAKFINKVYWPFLQALHRLQIFFGGSSSGKSYFLAQRCVLDVIYLGRNYLIVRNVRSTIRSSVFNEICKCINNLKLSKFFLINRSDFSITCICNMKQILFRGLDDPEKLKSITPINGVITDIWIEEATETSYKAYKQLLKRLRGKSKNKKRVILSFNPIAKDHWIFKEFFGHWDDSKNFYSEDEILILRTTYKDNQFLTEEDKKLLEEETDIYYYDVYTLGKWGVLGAVIFTNWGTEDLTWLMEIATNRRNGLDFGYAAHPAGLCRSHCDPKRKIIYVLKEVYEKGLTNDALAQEILPVIEDDQVICDSAEPKSIDELIGYGVNAIPAIKGGDSVNYGIQYLQQYRMIVDYRCQHMINELTKYKWKEDKNGLILPIPVKRDDHLIDALRYSYSYDYNSGIIMPDTTNRKKNPIKRRELRRIY